MLEPISLLSCRVRIIPCLLAVLAGLAASLGFVPGLHQRVADEWQMARYNAGAGAFDSQVRFWGKVVDQDGRPVDGAAIAASVTTLRMIKVEGGYREYEILHATSGADGTFGFDGSKGMYLDIETLGKDGYVLPSAYQAGTRWPGAKYHYRYFSMGDHEDVFRPNPGRPEVFHLWKLKRPEPLEIIDDTGGLNGPILRVGAEPESYRTVSMMLTDVGTPQSPQSPQWELTVSALEPDAGVIKANSSDIFMFEAPPSGYTHSIKFLYGPVGADQGAGEPGSPVRFFVRSHHGRWYGAAEYAFFSPDQDGRVRSRMGYWINPNGSRNLEHDAAHPLPEPLLNE